jgi:hypothetical protein
MQQIIAVRSAAISCKLALSMQIEKKKDRTHSKNHGSLMFWNVYQNHAMEFYRKV